MPSSFLVIRPAAPNSRIIDSDSTNGGDTTGSSDTMSNSFFVTLLRTDTYTSTYANSRPISSEPKPVSAPSSSVLSSALLNV